MAKKPLSNTEFLTDLMERSPSGAIMQMLILDLLGKAAKLLAETPIQEVRDAFGPNAFIHPDAWHEAAVELNTKLTARYGN